LETTHEELLDEIEKYVLSEDFKKKYLPQDVYLVHSREVCLSKYIRKRRADFKAFDSTKGCLILGESKSVDDKKILKDDGEFEERFLGQLQTYLKYLSKESVSHLVYGVPLTKADTVFYAIKREATKMKIKDITIHLITINHVHQVKKI
tara:strand:+ start:1426 stop:1872 length:447 start_codon:yes stop_codon:yes gene_type:complete